MESEKKKYNNKKNKTMKQHKRIYINIGENEKGNK